MDDFKLIEDQLNYDMFLAEQTMNMELRRLERKMQTVTESTEIIALNEAMSDVMKKYMTKITEGIQKAWNSFKQKINDAEINKIITPNNKYIENAEYKGMKLPDGYEYPELLEWNRLLEATAISKVDLQANNYEQYKPYLESTDKFLQQYFPDVYENGKKPSEVFNEKCFSKAGNNKVVDSKLAVQYRDFLLKYAESVNQIQDDIQSINEKNNAISDMVKAIGESALLEDGEQEVQVQKTTVQTTTANNNAANNAKEDPSKFRNADGTTAKNANGGQDRKNIVTYYKGITSILTAKMRTCNKIRNNSMKIIKNYIKLQGGNVNVIKPKEEEKK